MSEPDEATPAKPNPPVLSYQTPGVSDSRTWTTVWTGHNTMEANLMVNKLQSLGLRARVDMENSAYLGGLAGNIYGTKVQVVTEDVEAARTILGEIDQRRHRRLEARTLRCPKCGTPDPKRKMHALRWAGLASIAAVFVLVPILESLDLKSLSRWALILLPAGFFMLVWTLTPLWRCKQCGFRWSQAEPEELDEDDDDEDDANDDRDDEDDGNETRVASDAAK